jgi:hypothetical protein
MPAERDPNYRYAAGGADAVQHQLGHPVGLVELREMLGTINDGPSLLPPRFRRA